MTHIKITITILFLTLLPIFYTEFNVEPQKINIKDITIFDINKPVQITATPTIQNVHQGHLILTLEKNYTTIPAIFFNCNKTLEKKEMVFYAKISQYQGEPQLQISKIIEK